MLSVRPLTKIAPHVRNMSVVSGPPSIRLGGLEKLAHGVVIIGSCLFIPGYVLINIPMIGLSVRFAGKVMKQARFRSIVAGPPSVRISFAEKCGHAFFSFVVMCIIPTYISYNLPYYKGMHKQEDDK